jgi:hypothetical protein
MASTSVVLPWSTWATIATLRRSSLVASAMGNILVFSRKAAQTNLDFALIDYFELNLGGAELHL